MKITQLYIYPIKSLRPTALIRSRVTRHGLAYDRHFMLLKVQPDKSLKNMQVCNIQQMALFSTDVVFPGESVDGVATEEGRILVRYQTPVRHPDRDAIKELEIPLEPTDLQGLRVLEVDMYNSKTQAYEMDKKYSDWFSKWFGFEVLLVYLGENRRPVLGNVPPNAAAKRAGAGASQPASKNAGGGWISNIAKSLLYLGSATPFAKRDGDETDEWITFADMAPYLVVSETSLEEVSDRLPEGDTMDVTKFRPNIVISGAEEAYEEDFWGEITVQADVNLILTANCGRCVSINVDYDTGAPGSGEAGTMLKKLMKDRRVDKGHKYSPVFGRYGFIDKGADGSHIEVGDEVVVSRRNKERTTFSFAARRRKSAFNLSLILEVL
ncbi:MOSC domain-containing protein [Histoplasma capsulatum var. duboisii H88]|uniref:MOSC domain-containing protein n=1 Tax=Ajellomyces capsulatus (strain H88) TaxID=544711 RepID=F0U9D1_AJEC8|nr:MOSC domain-containing protein [Histoplasma capsulatum var. duboisii H88]